MYSNPYRQLRTRPYDRDKAVEYAHMWAKGRNPAYLDFENYGGDCTNFASQCIYAGSGVMNWTPIHGWYYASSYNRTASWTGVNYLYDFLINNKGEGPYAELVDISCIQPGDIAQLSFSDKNIFNHSPVIIGYGKPPSTDNLLVASHTYDADDYPVKGFEPVYYRYLHIIGVRG